ncbi:Dam family site-specific DNA-(adenine-N6)-methyltransferase [Mycoplasma enhydrae]|uniref:DNA adenine methylase n=1 Tax=Mycoplasma enhydrae TaxID=2499220 RepID=UPI00197BAEE0|nr:Dam family site-specific DNA-(adenine-N6)-methyltransferase [Mycoplasma enhydrae]MBN4089373.1 Dam family site-specific DNA-(adenine-N6)-methyltransferase [Mycoplasma enhydrae]MCV3733745.1 Dam family site-specific DNA-(adenine-N6)-methyltransferase [Mycoplasma enhydrae]MCV3753607.1 Dam family site-specific DNA-(adenine-N6)-methyltransferase [Mycoplasma enhydrae]
MKRIKPFVKWAGGKTKLISTIKELMPKKFNNYFEPFVGGGALFFDIQPKQFHINDLNEDLIWTYRCFSSLENFNKLKNELLVHQNSNSEDYFYIIRNMDRMKDYSNIDECKKAARLIYLNKSCFNGLYRVNSKGYFNVPFGKRNEIMCFDEDNLNRIFDFFSLSNGKITNYDFEEVIKEVKKGDFVYFDPPYDVLDSKDSFTSYNKQGFNKNEQQRLFEAYKKLDERGAFLMLSNHNTQYINELYKDYNINIVKVKRLIGSNVDSRKFVEEVIITNY